MDFPDDFAQPPLKLGNICRGAVPALGPAVWQLVIFNEHIYRVISIPIWCAVFALSAAYLVFGALKVIKSSAFYCEVEPLWN